MGERSGGELRLLLAEEPRPRPRRGGEEGLGASWRWWWEDVSACGMAVGEAMEMRRE